MSSRSSSLKNLLFVVCRLLGDMNMDSDSWLKVTSIGSFEMIMVHIRIKYSKQHPFFTTIFTSFK